MEKIIAYTVEYRDKFGKKTGKTKLERVICKNPCRDFIMGGCGICPPSCHQSDEDVSHDGNKGHVYKHEDADCEKCGAPWADTKSYCPIK